MLYDDLYLATVTIVGSFGVCLLLCLYDPEAVSICNVEQAVLLVFHEAGYTGEAANLLGFGRSTRFRVRGSEHGERVGNQRHVGHRRSGSSWGRVDSMRPAGLTDVQDESVCGRVETQEKIFFTVFLDQQHSSYGTAVKRDMGNDVGRLVGLV